MLRHHRSALVPSCALPRGEAGPAILTLCSCVSSSRTHKSTPLQSCRLAFEQCALTLTVLEVLLCRSQAGHLRSVLIARVLAFVPQRWRSSSRRRQSRPHAAATADHHAPAESAAVDADAGSAAVVGVSGATTPTASQSGRQDSAAWGLLARVTTRGRNRIWTWSGHGMPAGVPGAVHLPPVGVCLVPPVGLEPTTCGLKVRSSTN